MSIKTLLIMSVLSLPVTLYADSAKLTLGKHECIQPGPPPVVRGQAYEYQQQVNAYKTCMNDYIKEHNDKVQELSKEAQAHAEAATAAVKEWNEFATASSSGNSNKE